MRKPTGQNATDASRRFFKAMYGEDTVLIVRAFAAGLTTRELAEVGQMSQQRAAAYMSHVARGTYAPFVKRDKNGNIRGLLNYKR